MKKLTYIPIEEIYPHPDNPRKELGDLTELADSIKASGIMQNLTVVCREEGGYTAIIGHRRLAASKLAGLTEVPCVIVDMTPQEQLATMLLENMQRSDLTAYEQAQGFQLMIDFGETVDTVAEKTGFSKTTVRRRLEMAKLDAEKMKKVSHRQISIEDFDSLAKIDDLNERNKLLDSIGTSNFANACSRVLDEQERKKYEALWREYLTGKGLKEIKYNDCFGNPDYRIAERSYQKATGIDPKNHTLNGDEQFFAFSYGSVYFRRSPNEKDKESADAQKAVNAEKMRQREALEDSAARAYALRFEFVKNLSSSACKKHLDKIILFAISRDWKNDMFSGWQSGAVNNGQIAELLGIHRENGERLEWEDVEEVMKNDLERCLLYNAYSRWNDGEKNGFFDYSNYHKKNKALRELYDFLTSLGYEMSDEEIAMMDGTSELLEKKVEE